MTLDQIRKYRCFVRDWKAARESHGLPCDDDTRYGVHRRVTGRACSSTEFTNKEFDDVLRRLKAETDAADYFGQVSILESPDRRKAVFLERCYDAVWEIYNQGGNNGLVKGEARTRYVATTCQNLNKRSIEECSAEEIAIVLGVIEKHVNRLKAKNAARVAEARGETLPPETEPESSDHPF